MTAGGCGRREPGPLLRSYADVVRDYEKRFRQWAADDLHFYATQESIADAVRLATLAQTADGKRQSHQRRIPPAALRSAYAKLKHCDFNRCPSFHELHRMVEDAILSIPGIGPLAVYDTAHRIGAHLRFAPEKVYLHCGIRDGARAMGLGKGTDTLAVQDLPAPFRRLTAASIEDCLGIYKEDLKRISGRQ